eukprot:90492-Pleurochrysis_carterae.AAC.1
MTGLPLTNANAIDVDSVEKNKDCKQKCTATQQAYTLRDESRMPRRVWPSTKKRSFRKERGATALA